MDDFLYNLRKKTKDKRKDHSKRSYDNSRKPSVDRRTGKDRRLRKNRPLNKTTAAPLMSSRDIADIQRTMEGIKNSQHDMLNALREIDRFEKRKLNALESIIKELNGLKSSG